ncbi:MAG: hypothetical protein WCC10_02110 [Tumebacillaceae bacterium]
MVEVFELLNASSPTSDRLGGAADFTRIKDGKHTEDRIYRPGYTSDSDRVIKPDLVPSVQDWIVSITQVDPPNEYNKDALSSLPGQYIGRGMGQSKRMDKASKTSESEVPIFELRGLAKSVPLDNWTDIAFEVYQAIMSIKQAKERAEQHEFPELSTLEAQPEPPSATYPIPPKE